MNTENYKNKRKEDKKFAEQKQELERVQEANKRNEERKFYTISGGVKADFQPRKSIFTDRDNSLIVNDRLTMERWEQHFYETLNIKDDVGIREK
jgi:hypothetical protein